MHCIESCALQGAGAGKGVLGTHVPLLKEQQETEAERGHPVKVEAPAAAAKRPKAGQPGSSVPPEDVHTVQEGDREVIFCLTSVLNSACTPALARASATDWSVSCQWPSAAWESIHKSLQCKTTGQASSGGGNIHGV